VEIRAGLFVLRNPSAAEHKMFRTQVLDDETKGIATTNLFVNTCVYPDRQAVSAALARFPGILANPKIQRALAYLSGQSDTLEGKS
jgi:hypothetical protein